MQNIKYHLANTVAIVCFSYITAITVNQFVKYTTSPVGTLNTSTGFASSMQRTVHSFGDYQEILDSGFFELADIQAGDSDTLLQPGELRDLILMGTISGPWQIARALIKNRSEKDPRIYKLGNTIAGYKLVRINNAKVYLKKGDSVEILDLYDKGQAGSTDTASPTINRGAATSSLVKKSLSRAEIQQKVLNNIDNALKGIRAGPFRVKGKIEGYKLFKVQPYNILYKLGARSGDVVKRINGHQVDSTEKLVKMWENLKNDSRISVDLERGGKLIRYDMSITD